MKRIALLTSGGDAPGMNAAIRAVVRTGIYFGMEVFGVNCGYSGLINDEIIPMNMRSVSDIVQRGGTLLRTARCLDMLTKEGQKRAVKTLENRGIEGLVVIGGDGSFRGAKVLTEDYGIPTIGIPGTIDNDITATDNTIGFTTAMEAVMENIDRLRDTCESHARCNVVEVMGRGAGDIAINTAIACGAVDAVIPEVKFDEDACIEKIIRLRREGKRNFIIVVSEGVEDCSERLAKKINTVTKELSEKEGKPSLWVETKFCRLAHVVRGGTPSLSDRILATKMGVRAVDELLAGNSDLIICEKAGEIVTKGIFYSQVLDRKYKGTLKEGMLEKCTPEQIAEMDAIIEEKKRVFAETYKLLCDVTA